MKRTTNLSVLFVCTLLLSTSIQLSANSDTKKYLPVQSWQNDGLIEMTQGILGGPFSTLKECENKIMTRLNELSKVSPMTWEITTRQVLTNNDEFESRMFMYKLREDGSVQSQHSCLEIR